MLLDAVICVMLILGSVFMFFAALGIARFSDALCRAHALSKATTFGICLLLVALAISLDNDVSRLKVFLVLAFSLLTIPVASHLVALLLYHQEKKEIERRPK
jgi:multicomponent Na+:H+ antiporter subunit G